MAKTTDSEDRDFTDFASDPWVQWILSYPGALEAWLEFQSRHYQKKLQTVLERGIQRGESKLLLRQLTRRFGSLDEATQEQVRRLPSAQLEALGEALLDFKGRDELTAWLAQLEPVSLEQQDADSAEPAS